MSFLFLPLLWSLGGQFYAAILSILCSSISITWPLGTLFYLIPPYLTQYLTHPPTSQPAGKIRFTESNGMYIRMAGRHCAEFLITLFHKVTLHHSDILLALWGEQSNGLYSAPFPLMVSYYQKSNHLQSPTLWLIASMAENSECFFNGSSEVGLLLHGNTNLQHQRQDHERNTGKECVAAKTGHLFFRYTSTGQQYSRLWQWARNAHGDPWKPRQEY